MIHPCRCPHCLDRGCERCEPRGLSRRSFFFFGAILAARPGIVVPEAKPLPEFEIWKYEWKVPTPYWHSLPPYVPMNWAEVPWERKDGPLITRLLVPNQTGSRHG